MGKNNYLEEIFNRSPIGILFYDKKGKLIDANPIALKLTEIFRLNISKEVNLFDNLHVASKKEVLIKKGFINFQINLNSRHNLDYSIFIMDSGYLVQIQDINVEKPEIPIQNGDKYRHWFDDDLTGDFIATPEGKILECNPSFADIYGFESCEEAIMSSISGFNPNDWANLISNLKKEHKIQEYQSWHKSNDGKKIHIIANIVGIFKSEELIQVKGYIFDDTERKKADEALIESEEKYHLLFDEDLTGDFIATPEGQILECNPSFADIYGFYDCEQALTWNISESNPFDWPYIVTRLKNECKIQGFQSWQRRYDGMRIHVIANVVGIFNETDELIQVKGYVFDDTERKKAEEELSRSRSQIAKVLDSIKDGFMALSHYWNFIYVNKCAADYFGMESEDLIGQNLWKMFPELKGTIYETLFHNAIEKHEIQRFEAHGGLKPDRWFDFSVYPSDDGISVFWIDITHEKQ
ncbi:MAG: PAS domain S-box protein [Methanobacterium sp.]